MKLIKPGTSPEQLEFVFSGSELQQNDRVSSPEVAISIPTLWQSSAQTSDRMHEYYGEHTRGCQCKTCIEPESDASLSPVASSNQLAGGQTSLGKDSQLKDGWQLVKYADLDGTLWEFAPSRATRLCPGYMCQGCEVCKLPGGPGFPPGQETGESIVQVCLACLGSRFIKTPMSYSYGYNTDKCTECNGTGIVTWQPPTGLKSEEVD